MRIIRFTLFAAFITAFLSGCVVVNFTDHNTVTGKGSQEKYEFKVGEFSGIKVEGFCNVRYYAAYSDTVVLEVQPNLLEYFVVEVDKGDLVIRTTRRLSYNSSNSPTLTVSTPALNRLTIEGAGNFTAIDKIATDSLAIKIGGASDGKAELDVERLLVDITGAGDFELSGRADSSDLNLSGVGELDALSLQAREATVSLSGAGTIRISCSENLRINADGAGTVEYRGSPSLNLNRDGITSVRQVK